MSVIVLSESSNGKLKKAAFETAYYGQLAAKELSCPAIAVVVGSCSNISELESYGVDKILHVDDSALDHFDDMQYASVLKQIFEAENGKLLVLSHTAKGKSLLGRMSVVLDAACVSGVNSLPKSGDGLEFSKSVFSGKAIAHYKTSSVRSVVSLMGNSIKPVQSGDKSPVETYSASIPESKVKVINSSTVEGTVPLPEAELVVSAGRGMKGPENWGIIEELADSLSATTACSRPVADTGWRPHHEHVGQTGVAIRPNLYIAIGISGAIQHLAGVNNSKVIVVINKDPEAPFFKAADYGVCADLFDVVPKLTESIKAFKAS